MLEMVDETSWAPLDTDTTTMGRHAKFQHSAAVLKTKESDPRPTKMREAKQQAYPTLQFLRTSNLILT